MRFGLRTASGAVWALLGVLLPLGAHGVTVSGSSSTVMEWYDDPDGNLALPLYEYLALNVRDVGAKGYNFRGYGRLGWDPKNEADADSRLYYGYLEKADFLPGLDFRLGRQFISTTAAASMMDGLDVRYRNLGPLAIELFGGGDVTEYESYGASDLIWGAEVSGRFADALDVALSYVQTWDGDKLQQELIGFDGNYDCRGMFDAYTEVQFSYLTNAVTYFLGGAKYHRDPLWYLRVDYLYSLPVFDSTSIYSVFAVSEYQEVQGEFGYEIGRGLRTFAQYTYEIYQDLSNANVVEAGIEKLLTGRFTGYLTAVLRDDADGQDLYGFKARAAYAFTDRLQAGVGANVDVLERDPEDDDDTTSQRYWADATARLTKKINVQAKVEAVKSDLWDYYTRGRIRLNIAF